ncbi:MAG: diacylglycerol kinase family protein [Candidatus Shapirobacteria bacterium]|jgi:diacylglycerol kinase
MKRTKRFFKCFEYARDGIVEGFRERNMKIHGLTALSVIFFGILFDLVVWEWIVIFLLFGMVMGAELINTSIEDLANVIRDKEGLDYRATKTTRDLAAGAVLVTAIMSAIIGTLIFGSKLF